MDDGTRMSKREKRLSKVAQNTSNVRFETLDGLLREFGFMLRSRKGSHCNYKHTNSPRILTIVCANPLDPRYVEEALQLIRECELDSE
jgi:predicted RNA binding protein YcfA (HicA-like mRNA interferase family)